MPSDHRKASSSGWSFPKGHALVPRPVSLLLVVAACVPLAGASATLAELSPVETSPQLIAGGFEAPTGLAVHPEGDLFVSDLKTGVLYRLTPAPDGRFIRGLVYAGLDHPVGVAVEPGGHLLVAEAGKERVVRFAKLNGLFSAVPEPVIEKLRRPLWLTPDGIGNIFVSASGVEVPKGRHPTPQPKGDLLLKHDLNGHLSVVADRFKQLRGLTFDSTGNLLVASRGRKDNQRETEPGAGAIFAIHLPQNTVSRVIGSGFKAPRDLTVDILGALFFTAKRSMPGESDPAGMEQETDETAGLLEEDEREKQAERYGKPARGVILKAAFKADGTLQTLTTFAAGLRSPSGLAFDREGHLYVADASRGLVLRFQAPAPPVLDPPLPLWTNQRLLTVKGAAEPHTLITVLGGMAPMAGITATPTNAARGTFELMVPLTPNTQQTLRVLATGGEGNGLTSVATETAVTQDELPPETLITGGSSGVLSSSSATFTFTGSDNLSQPEHLRFAQSLDEAPYSPLTAGSMVTLTNLSPGSHTFRVKAQDQAGNDDPTPAERTFTVLARPTITGVSPMSGSVGSTVTISGQNFETTAANNRVTFNGVAAIVTSATSTTITATVPSGAGSGLITVTTPGGTETFPTAFSVVIPLVLMITGPADGATIAATNVLVRGTIVGAVGDSAVSVNGVPAYVNNGQWVAEAPLVSGSNILIVTATDATGVQSTASRAVIGAPPLSEPVLLRALPESGVSPLVVTWQVLNQTGRPLVRFELDEIGSGTFGPPMAIFEGMKSTYTAPGFVFPTLRVTDDQGRTYTTSTIVNVETAQAVTLRFQSRWNGFKARLQAGDISGALGFLAPGLQPRFQILFQQLGPDLPAIAAGLGTLEVVEQAENLAETAIIQQENGVPVLHFLYFRRDSLGRWLIEEM